MPHVITGATLTTMPSRCAVLGLSALVFSAVSALGEQANACSFAASFPVETDRSIVSQDNTPPVLVDITVERIRRGTSPTRQVNEDGTEVFTSSSCDDLGSLALGPSAVDDTTDFLSLRYRVELVEGEAPMALPDGGLQSVGNGQLRFAWVDGAEKTQEAFRFQLQVSAMDLAGNESEPLLLWISDPGRLASPAGTETEVTSDQPELPTNNSAMPNSARMDEPYYDEVQSEQGRGLPVACSVEPPTGATNNAQSVALLVLGLVAAARRRQRRRTAS